MLHTQCELVTGVQTCALPFCRYNDGDIVRVEDGGQPGAGIKGPYSILAFWNSTTATMDENVIAAMARWPDVPDVFGWLSLTERGQWRLHPQGDALLPVGVAGNGCSPGQAITSPPILHFIDRNYAADTHGRWYFQNGPQRVYVRLDAAPSILHTSGPADELPFRPHTRLDAADVTGRGAHKEGK